MEKHLNKAPLVHVVVHLRYSKIPELAEPSSLIRTDVTKQMVEIGFPELIESMGTGHHISISANEPHTSTKNIYRSIFRAAGQHDCVVLTDDSLVLKTTKYDCFPKFFEKFNEILSLLENTIDGFKKTVIKSIGFRYSNLVAPIGNTNLDDYIVDGVLPVRNLFDSFETKIGISQASVAVEQNQTLRLLVEEVLVQNGMVTKVLPDDLLEPDNNAALLIPGFDYWAKIKASRYALIDIVHAYDFPASPLYDRKLIVEKFDGLHTLGCKTFWDMMTDTAKEHWEAVER